MKEWSDEELDKLFRESSEKLDPIYEPGDWAELKQRLDVADGVEAGGWLQKATPWLAALLLILIGGIGAYLIIGGNEGEKVPSVVGTRPAGQTATTRQEVDTEFYTEKDSKTGTSALAPSTSAARSGTKVYETNERTSTAAQPALDSPSSNKKEPPLANQAGQEARKNFTNEKGPKELPRRRVTASGVRDQPELLRQGRGNGAILSINDRKETRETGSALAVKSQAEQGREVLAKNEWPALTTLSHRAANVTPAALNYPAVKYKAPADYVAAGPSAAPVEVPKWSIRFGVSPDLSMVKGSNMMRSASLGPAGSLLVERSLGQRFSVQTGIIRSLKNYYAKGSEYQWAWGKKQPEAPSSVDVRCSVIEIPVNFRLDLSQKARSRFFASAGVSSYKMQKESQTYNYDTYVHDAKKSWEGKTGWYPLSHANVSVGYERFVAKRLSIVAEPYARIPMRGVGMGKVNLVTMGVWFSVRYTPVFRK